MTAIVSAHETYDAVIIGGGVGGLVAACYLARAKARVLVLEMNAEFGGLAGAAALGDGFSALFAAHAVYALDPKMLRELNLSRHGLRFAQRDMATIALRPGGRHITLPRRTWRARAAIAAFAPKDAENYLRFKRAVSGMARRLRPLWSGDIDASSVGDETALAVAGRRLALSDHTMKDIEAVAAISAAAYLDHWFESDALKAALGFDAALGGLSPHEAGSALMLIWRHAQGSFWRRSAAAQLRGGPEGLAAALENCARRAGVELMSSARVERIIVDGGRAAGVMLATGEVFRARAVLSSLDQRRTLLELVPPARLGFDAAASVPEPSKTAFAKVNLALGSPPPFAGLKLADLRGRLIIADRPESASEVKGASLTGELAPTLVMEATVPTAADPSLAPAGSHILSVLLPLLPTLPKGGWDALKAALRKQTLGSLESFAPGLKDRVLAAEVLSPDDIALRYGSIPAAPSGASRLLESYAQRVRTAVPGLYLCGGDAEPVDTISGRAGRIAAAYALADSAHGAPP